MVTAPDKSSVASPCIALIALASVKYKFELPSVRPSVSVSPPNAGGVYVNTPVELLYDKSPFPAGVPSEPTLIAPLASESL